jgi:hypothetical protein
MMREVNEARRLALEARVIPQLPGGSRELAGRNPRLDRLGGGVREFGAYDFTGGTLSTCQVGTQWFAAQSRSSSPTVRPSAIHIY